MMSDESFKSLSEWIHSLATSLAADQSPNIEGYAAFLRDDQLVFELVDLIQSLPDESSDEGQYEHAACLLAFDICVAQLQAGVEHKNKHAIKLLNQLMIYLAQAINQHKHTLGFWLPVLNAFYESQIELPEILQQAYLDAAGQEEELAEYTELDHLSSIKEMLAELSDLSVFDIAEHFFSQSHAMPADFFIDLVFDLCSLQEGQDIGVLFLLHPKAEVRAVVVAVLDQIISKLELSNLSLSRLKTIKHWYPMEYAVYFDRWVKEQRKKGGVYSFPTIQTQSFKWHATEVDGSGSQGVFIQVHQHKMHRICGLLFKASIGIKDAWLTSSLSRKDVTHYCKEAFDERMSLREVDQTYVQKMTNHFLWVSQKNGSVPPLHLLEIQEILGVELHPEPIDMVASMQELGVQIIPFTSELLEEGVKRSRFWFRDKPITQSWFEEDSKIDIVVNQCCNFVDGVKICTLDRACKLVMDEVLELKREKWAFHFLWTALWAKAKARKQERFWQDCFFVAYAITEGWAFENIPVFQDIAHLTVMNSIETMSERRSYLNISHQ
jgi:hypothetical protein